MTDQDNKNPNFPPERIFNLVIQISAGIIMFVVFSYFTFPYGKLVQGLISRLEARVPISIQFKRVKPTFLMPGLYFRNVKISTYSYKKAGNSYEPYQMDLSDVLEFDRLKVRINPFAFFKGGFGILLYASLSSGEIKGSYFLSSEEFRLRGKWQGIHLEGIAVFQNRWNSGIAGSMSGEVSLEGERRDIRTGKGSIEFSVKDGEIKGSRIVKVLSLPDLVFQKVEGKLIFKEGKLLFDQVKAEGKDLQVELEGNITVRKPLDYSILALNLKVRPSSELDSQIGYLFSTLLMRKDSSGFYNRRFSGTLRNPI